MRSNYKIVVVLISMCAALLLGELIVRSLFGQPNPLPIDPHHHRTFTSRPLSSGVFPVRINESEYQDFPYHISSLGLRDREYAPKQSKEVRIALLGDSMTMGWGLHSNETIARRLEKLLMPFGNVRVINAGQFGYGPVQELNLLEETIGALEPDIIVHSIFMGNDVADSALTEGLRLRSHNLEALVINELMKRDSNSCYRANRWLREHSRIYLMVTQLAGNPAPICALVNLEGALPPISISPNAARPSWLEVNLEQWYPELDQSWEITKGAIRGIQHYSDQREIKLFVYAQPSLADISPMQFRNAARNSAFPEAYEFGKAIRTAEDFFQEEEMASIDVQSTILAQRDPEHAFYLWDGHLTPDGADWVARAISENLYSTLRALTSRP